MDGIVKRKTHGDELRDKTLENVVDFGVRYQVFSNVLIENVTVRDSPDAQQAFRFHNSDKPASLDVEGVRYNLVLRRCDVDHVRGDGIYLTRVNGVLIENCSVVVSLGHEADGCQLALERKDEYISRNVLIRGNVFTYDPQSDSGKGALVCARTQTYRVENNLLEGRNFGFSSFGDAAIVRSNLIRTTRMNDYSSGYMIGERTHCRDHHVYDNWIENGALGIGISSFKDQDVTTDGVQGYQRSNLDIHDNVIADCDVAFRANRPWSGRLRRNILMRCGKGIVSAAQGRKTATLGDSRLQEQTDIFTNDGSFLNTEPPVMTVGPDGTASVSSGRWTTAPDEIRLYWRDRGNDISGANRPSVKPAPGMELSCVVLARKGGNWMLAIAEMPWSADAFVPRAHTEGKLPWRNRYIDIPLG